MAEPELDPETPVAGWQYLVRRRHPWRQQLYVKGRNMTARQLVGSMRANDLDEEKTAADFHLPVEVVREALAYVEANKELLETELELHQANQQHPDILAVYQDNDPSRDMSQADIVKAIANIEATTESGGDPITGEFHSLNDWRY